MEKGYIAPEAALKKLRAAKGLGQTVYIYGATGYGKTALVKQYLSKRRYHYISCAEDAAELVNAAEEVEEKGKENLLSDKGAKAQTAVVVDDLHLLKNAQGRRAVLSLVECRGIWLVLICRSPIPAWLMPPYVNGGFLVITEEDLRLKEKEISAYMESQGIAITEEELAFVAGRSQGNAYTVRHTALRMLEGQRPGPELAQEIVEAFAGYLESHVMMQWDSDLLEFLMQVSVTDEFTLPLAEMITGNCRALELLERAAETGNFLSCEDGIYRLRPQLLRALRRRAAREFDPAQRADHAYNAGLYYEMQGQIVSALDMFERCGKKERIRGLLIRNARLNPGNGHYFELRRYYLQMEEKELEDSPVLMAGMSMLYSLLMQEKESEYWYGKLEKNGSGSIIPAGAYTVSYSSNIDKGKATVTATGIPEKGCSSSVQCTFQIGTLNLETERAAGNIKITMPADISHAKGGAVPQPVITHTYHQTTRTLREGADYALKYSGNMTAGGAKTPTVKITGIGNYSGSITETYVISAQGISRLSVTVTDRAYRKNKKGSDYYSAPKVYDLDGKQLKSGKDYTVAYTYADSGKLIGKNDKIPAGTKLCATVTAAKNSSYTGTQSAAYFVREAKAVKNIAKAKIDKIAPQQYTGSAVTPEIRLYEKTGKTKNYLTSKDYEIIGCYNNTKRGTASILVRGKGAYSGVKRITFKIVQKKIK